MACSNNPLADLATGGAAALVPSGSNAAPGAAGYGPAGNAYLGAMNAYAAGEPQQVALQQEYQPTYTSLDLQNMEQFLNGSGSTPGYLSQYENSVVPAITAAGTAANTATRTANVNDLSTLGPAGLTAIQGLNPGQTALTNSLTSTATNQLALGTQLDPNQVSQINEATNANWAGRGLGGSNPAMLDTALNYYGGGQSLLAQRESEAGTVANLNQGEYTDPLLSMLGLNSQASTLGLPTSSTANSIATGAGPTVFSNQDATSLFSGIYNQQANSAAASQNSNAALCGSGLSGGTSLAGAGIMAAALA